MSTQPLNEVTRHKRESGRYVYRKAFLVFCSVSLLIGLIYLFLHAYDAYFSEPDGLINRYAYHNIFRLIYTAWFLCFVLYLGLSSRHQIVQNAALSLSATAVLLILLEVAAHVLIATGTFGEIIMEFRRYHISLAVTDRNRGPLFWGDFSHSSGRWRVSNASYSALYCGGDSVSRRTNSIGATDVERTVRKSSPGQKRVVTLGDSFVEGMLVNADDRVSNRLEATTGREHLNFAINGSSPINYYLIYKSIAKRFEHDVVLVGVLPANDFQDYTPSEAYTLTDWPIYRPYWQGQYPAYSLKYSLNNLDQSIARNDRSPAKLLQTVDSVYRQLPFADQIKASVLLNSALFNVIQHLAGRGATTNGQFTRYEQFSETEFRYMRHSLEQLVREAKGKQVVFLSIPIQNDIDAIRNGHKNNLDGRLRAFCNQHGILFVPLLPEFLTYSGNVADLYVPCDGHWSKKGEQFVSDVLLRNPRYRALLD